MQTKTLLQEAFAYAWQKTTAHYRTLAFVSLVYGLTLFASDFLSYVLDEKSQAYLVLAYLTAVLSVVFNLGYIRIALLLEDGNPASGWLLVAYGRYIWPFVALNFIIGLPLIMLALLVFKFIPYSLPILILGICYLLVRVSFFSFFIAAANQSISVWQSLVMSFHATRKFQLIALLMILIEFIVLILGALAIGIGLVWAVPFTTFANTYIFRKMRVTAENAPGSLGKL